MSQQKAQVLVKFPHKQPEKPCCNKQQQVVVVHPEKKCMKGCCPKLDNGNNYGVCCRDTYLDRWCNNVGITGLLGKKQCIVYDEQWGGCGTCIGCKDDCKEIGICGYQGNFTNGGYGPRMNGYGSFQ